MSPGESLRNNMKHNFSWIYLYNCLYLTSSRYDEVRHLESNIFEVMDELETALHVGMHEDRLDEHVKEGLINEERRIELGNFRNYVLAIEPHLWNPEEFDRSDDWDLARKWANTLLMKLNLKKRGWDSSGEYVIYTGR